MLTSVPLTRRCYAGLALRSRPSPRGPHRCGQRRRPDPRSKRSARVARSLSLLPICVGGVAPTVSYKPAHIHLGDSGGDWGVYWSTCKAGLHVIVSFGRLLFSCSQLPNSAMRRSPPTILPNSVPSSAVSWRRTMKIFCRSFAKRARLGVD